jgi:hypothetical protein
MSRIRRARRVKGLCAEPGCPAITGDSFRCKAHAAKYAARTRKYRAMAAQKKRVEAKLAGGG